MPHTMSIVESDKPHADNEAVSDRVDERSSDKTASIYIVMKDTDNNPTLPGTPTGCVIK